jgi:hypothetical protein
MQTNMRAIILASLPYYPTGSDITTFRILDYVQCDISSHSNPENYEFYTFRLPSSPFHPLFLF